MIPEVLNRITRDTKFRQFSYHRSYNMISIAATRLHNQQIAATGFTTPGELVAWLGAVQAQDYLGTLWALGLRLPHSTETQIEQALLDRQIVRTWPMRGTLHIVAAADVQWMVKLLAPRRLARTAGRRKQLGIDQETLAHSREVCRTVLAGSRQLVRPAMFAALEAHGIATTGQRGIHILGHLAQEGLLCFGPREGKQFTFVLLDEWVPDAKPLAPAAALAEITRRYFQSHGPATVEDFAWWTGLTLGEARRGLAAAAPHLAQEEIAGQTLWYAADSGFGSGEGSSGDVQDSVFLLPGFDEYMLGYTDRNAVLDPQHAPQIHPGANGVLNATLVVGGRIEGIWRRTLKKKSVLVSIRSFTPLAPAAVEAAASAAQRYAEYLELALELEFAAA
jgi:hypothetical protein